MKTVKLFLDYKCYPIWIYENDSIVSNDLSSINILKDNTELVNLLDDIQKEYDNLFVDNSIEFYYKGFESKESHLLFKNKLMTAYEKIKSCLKNDYIVINDTNHLFE